jgi:mannosyl-3-phosphoglycerate phosphatase
MRPHPVTASRDPEWSSIEKIVVFTDLDGSLLDAVTYSFDKARLALDELRSRNIPLILTSSKTRGEIEVIRHRLGFYHPFISENGGALFVPREYFRISLEEVLPHGSYHRLELGTPYSLLRTVLKEIACATECRLRGFGDMPIEEIVSRTGLPSSLARLAMQREYDEPFVVEGSPASFERFVRECERREIQCTRGGRFFHLGRGTDKGKACRHLIEWYRREYGGDQSTVLTIGIGDSANDLSMLEVVDRPILVQQPDGSYDPNVTLPNLTYSQGSGPAGWNQAVLAFLHRP